ncbi:MAG: hypothetical protein WC325_09070 [Candidatus Bathyarchaeia archaeon]
MQSQLSILERKVYDGRTSLKLDLPNITQVLTDATCFQCAESLNDTCKPQTCQKLTSWLLDGRFNQ